MNQFPLMRIQGRNALKIQSTLNNGLSKIYSKNPESKRQCNIGHSLIFKKEEHISPKEITRKEIELQQEKVQRRQQLRIKYKDQIEALKSIRIFFKPYGNLYGIYIFVERVCSYAKTLIYKDAGFERVDAYILNNVKEKKEKICKSRGEKW